MLNEYSKPTYVIGVLKKNRWHFLSPEMTFTFDRKTAKVYDDLKLAHLVAVLHEGNVIDYVT